MRGEGLQRDHADPAEKVLTGTGGNLGKLLTAAVSRLPSSMAQNLSVPLAFVALLHLANEKVSSSLDVLTGGRARL